MVDYVRGSNPVWSFVDLAGNQFDDTFYMWTLENTIPYIPATVYHTPTGTPWTDPIQFLANGTLPIDIYFDPNVVYRLEFRQAVGLNPPSQSDPLIYLVENYIPNGATNTPSTVDDTLTENQSTNGQFSIINFASPLVLTAVTNPDPIQIAPGWELILTGTGNLTLEQTPLFSPGTVNPTNAPYALHINLTGGWTGVPTLRQRFQQNGMLWADKYVSTSFTARISGASQNITARLVASDGAPLAILKTATLTNDFVQYTGFAQLPATANADVPPDAWIDYEIRLPTVADIYLTSIQVVASNTAANFEYEQDTIDRQIDHTFHYYKPLLAYKPIPSYLTGWDFPVNPAQFGEAVGPFTTGANGSDYVWDQTIMFQTADASFEFDRADSGALAITANQTSQMCLIQYVSAAQARELLNDRISVNLAAISNNVAGISGTISLYATDDTNLPSISSPDFDSIVLTVDANGKPLTTNGVWTEIPRSNYGDATFTLFPSTTNLFADYSFNGWDLEGGILASTATFFAIVIGFEEMDNLDGIDILSVSLQSGDIATRPAPKTFNETLLNCQAYYWKTFLNGTAPVQNAGLDTGNLKWQMFVNGANNNGYQVLFPTPMRATPVITRYNPAAANSNIRNFNLGADCSASSEDNITTKTVELIAQSAGGSLGQFLGVHVTADARLGVVN